MSSARPDTMSLIFRLNRCHRAPLHSRPPWRCPSRLVSSRSSQPVVTRTWIDRLPVTARPYLHLMRIDKPIGTLLLFYPCGSFGDRIRYIHRSVSPSHSVVHNHGLIRAPASIHRAAHVSGHIRNWCSRHAWGRVHDQ